jgi:hypothetical protein
VAAKIDAKLAPEPSGDFVGNWHHGLVAILGHITVQQVGQNFCKMIGFLKAGQVAGTWNFVKGRSWDCSGQFRHFPWWAQYILKATNYADWHRQFAGYVR